MGTELPKDRVKRYLVELLSKEYGPVYDGDPRPDGLPDPALGVEMRDDTSDDLGWAVCHAIVRGAFKRVESANNFDRARAFLDHVVDIIRNGVRRGLPVINGEFPPWYDVAFGDIGIRLKADVATFDVGCAFSTGLAPAEVK